MAKLQENKLEFEDMNSQSQIMRVLWNKVDVLKLPTFSALSEQKELQDIFAHMKFKKELNWSDIIRYLSLSPAPKRAQELQQFPQNQTVLYLMYVILATSKGEKNAHWLKEDSESTEQLQCKFDELTLTMEQSCQKDGVPAGKIVSFIEKGCRLPQEFKQALKQENDIGGIFSVIRVYSTWYEVTLLKQVAILLDTNIQDEISRFEDRLRTCFEKQTKPLPSVNGEEGLLLCINDAWDKEALQGEDCERSCKQIASILGKSGQITGSLCGRFLYISIT